MKIGFYLQNKGIAGIDCSDPMSGNPGIGGTEYLFTAVPLAVKERVEKAHSPHEIVLIANSTDRLPEGLYKVEANDENIDKVAIRNHIEIIVLRYSKDNFKIIQKLDPKIKIIFWCHNFVPRRELTLLAKANNVIAIVCVGSEQLNFYRDHRAYYKSVFIPNGYPVRRFLENEIRLKLTPYEKRANEVTFVGNLVEFKGFHLLAEAWPKVIEEVPDAHLNVIGGATLYDRRNKLGKYNLAEESYENLFMSYLTDENGTIVPSVTFHGVLGNEKFDILEKTKVGVPNPSGVSETFCIAALEMQLAGAVIATIDFGGFKDTVYSSGVLYKKPERLAESIVKQLRKLDNDYDGFKDFVEQFDFSEVAKIWLQLFDTLKSGHKLKDILKPGVPTEHRWKEINRKIKKILPFGSYLPTDMYYKSMLWRLKRIFKRNLK